MKRDSAASVTVILASLGFVAQALAADGTACENQAGCQGTEICLQGQCADFLGRTVEVTVHSAAITEKQRDGAEWDSSSKPDPVVVVYYPDKEKRFKTKIADNTLDPAWQQSFTVEIKEGNRAIWFCLFDDDTFGSEDIRVGKEGETSCVGYKDVLDLVRLGESTLETSGELKWLKLLAK